MEREQRHIQAGKQREATISSTSSLSLRALLSLNKPALVPSTYKVQPSLINTLQCNETKILQLLMFLVGGHLVLNQMCWGIAGPVTM